MEFKKVILVLLVAALPAVAADENIVLKKELNAPTVVVQPQVVQPVQAAAPVAQAVQPVQPIYVVEKQPTTYVEDAPLKDSKADQLRKQRENVERQTEERIVEKLEGDRVRAEEERAAKILDVMDRKPEPVKPVAEAPAPAPVVQPVPVIVAPAPIQQVKEELKDIKEEEKKPVGKMTASAILGYSAYPTTSNVKGGSAFGAGLGYAVDPQLSFGIEFIYSKFDVESPGVYYFDPLTGFYYPYVTRMDQYNIAANLKYRLLENSRLSPYVGGLVSYTIRNFANGNLPYQNTQNNSISSWAMDAGLIGGADFALSEKFTIGVDLRYIFNMTYSLNNIQNRNYYFAGYSSGAKAIESLNYYVVGVNGLLTF